MNFANYTAFRTAVLVMITGDDANTGALSQTTLDLLIAAGEQAVYYGMTGPQGEDLPGLRCADMETGLDLTVADNAAPLPTDCIELIRVQQDGENPLSFVSGELLRKELKATGSGAARQYTQQGRSIIFFPSLADGATVGGQYYKRFADILTGLNAAFIRYSDLWLYAALAESAPFLGEDQRIGVWKAQYRGRLMAADRTERLLASSGSRLTVRSR